MSRIINNQSKFIIKQYQVGLYRSASHTKVGKLGIKILIKPSKKSVKENYQKIAKIIMGLKNAPSENLKENISGRINPIIRGWCNYYSSVVIQQLIMNNE
ncbi:MAG: hypothetical protein F6K23_14305 [Okeania sp. SIO2C9]|uniref:group II intron maturase-specific domain-containing protein n=1 Tax=Okeania sp. SIO2C9 TaxID=2607791 RepID=UPI0013C05BE6|nr:group II intron maturase-specific domain-containing protein [Okeania sp. SIO2C9]NEQ74107.1 hypothetical protein [Okeania sp. SIO2C9]